ncbi:FAD-dependent oxidoreductase [Sciscionella sediminilitoris]|uniref:FAD-dependent oxidoreductase n=1 Tax=Sciscionella sediminilitoris TaxID=1445613 RepID=UPI00068F5C77|nr:FAD-dependent oxidoreductase [Sciscionella sp. SE31]
MSVSDALNAARRARELEALAAGERVDVLVAGQGAVAAATALDAAARGLSVCLLAPGDLAAASFPEPPVFALGRRAMAEQAAQLRIAPALVRPLPVVFPLYGADSGRSLAARLRIADGQRIGARIPARLLPPSRRIPVAEALALLPGLRQTDLRGALLAFTVWIPDSTGYVLALCRTAAGAGARILSHLRADALLATGALATDLRTGAQCSIRARVVIRVTDPHRPRSWSVLPGDERAGLVTRSSSAFPLDSQHLLFGSTVDGLWAWPRYRVDARDGILLVHGGNQLGAREVADAAIRASGVTGSPCATSELTLSGTQNNGAAALAELDPELGRTLPGTTHTAAEVVLAVRNAGALDAEDVLAHRLGYGVARSPELVATVADLVSRTLNGL